MQKEKKTWSTPQLLDLSSVDATQSKAIVASVEQAKGLPYRAEAPYLGPGSRGPDTTPPVS